MAPSATFNRIVLDTKRRWITEEMAEKLQRAITQDYVNYTISDLFEEINPGSSMAVDNKEG